MSDFQRTVLHKAARVADLAAITDHLLTESDRSELGITSAMLLNEMARDLLQTVDDAEAWRAAP